MFATLDRSLGKGPVAPLRLPTGKRLTVLCFAAVFSIAESREFLASRSQLYAKIRRNAESGE